MLRVLLLMFLIVLSLNALSIVIDNQDIVLAGEGSSRGPEGVPCRTGCGYWDHNITCQYYWFANGQCQYGQTLWMADTYLEAHCQYGQYPDYHTGFVSRCSYTLPDFVYSICQVTCG